MKFFRNFPEILAVMYARSDGNMKMNYDLKSRKSANKNRIEFFKKHRISPGKVHSALLSYGKKGENYQKWFPLFIDNTDAVVTKGKRIFLSVTVADCYPVLFYEPEDEIIGLAHAGRKGIIGGIIANTVSL